MLEYIFKAFLLTSLVGTALTLLLTAIKPITRKFLSSKWHYYLWLIVLVAMIVPFRFTEQVSQQPNENISIYSPIQESFHGEFNEMVGESNDNQMGIIDFLKLFADAQMQTMLPFLQDVSKMYLLLFFSIPCSQKLQRYQER